MPKQLFKKLTPHPDKVKNSSSLKFIQHLLHDPNIWHFNRRSVPKAFLIGIFCAFLPIPFQMLLAGSLALLISANISLALVLVWITNPLTMGPIFYCSYKTGCLILQTPEHIFNSGWSIKTIGYNLMIIWKPLWVGSIVLGAILSILSYYTVKVCWYFVIINRIKYRVASTKK